jgi:hypothetical protein
MEHPSLMVLYGRWIGKRFYIIANCIVIVQTPSLSYRLQLILQVYYMMILVGASVMLILKGQWG